MPLGARRIRQLYAWHKWTGLVTGVFVFVLSLTGAVAVFKEEIDWLLTPALRVAPRDAQGTSAPLDDAVRAARALYPEAEVEGITLAPDSHTAHRIRLDDRGTPREVFIDPHTGGVTGTRSGETFANVLRQLHVRFYYFGWQGRVVVGLFGVTLLITTVTGLFIYLPFMRAVFAKNLRLWQIRTNNSRFVISDLHKLVGILALVFNLVIALTGAVLGLENLARFSKPVQRALHPAPRQTNPPAALDSAISIDHALVSARAALPGFTPNYVEPPVAGKSHYVMRGNIAGHFAAANASFVVIDAVTGVPRDTHDARAARPVTRLYNLSEPLHFGDFAGTLVKILYAAFGFTSAFLSVTGYWLYALKRRRSRHAAAHAPVSTARSPSAASC